MAFRPLNSTNDYTQNIGQVNDMVRSINKEQQVKVFNGPSNTTAVQIGKYADSKYGLVVGDTSGFRRILLGQHPVTGEPGLYISISGIDVITELGG